jgi:hypothetical protein
MQVRSRTALFRGQSPDATRPIPRADRREIDDNGVCGCIRAGRAETEMTVKSGQEHWLDPDSYWNTTGERPLPEFDWGDA